MNDPQIFNITPEDEDLNIRLDLFISKYNNSISRSKAQNLIKAGFVKAGDEIVQSSSHKVKKEIYQITLKEEQKNHIIAKDIKLDIIYEDDDLLVINKQAGLTTHPGAGNYNDTLVNALLHYLQNNLSQIGGAERPGIVHRLDKDTSGLLIVAKNDNAHKHLALQLKTRELKRIYHAFCWGRVMPIIGKVETYIKRHKTNRLKMEVNKYDGKLAITNYKLIKQYKDQVSLIECSLQTGRTHQIRVHLSYIGYPIIGDKLYGHHFKSKYANLPREFGSLCKNFSRQALIAKKIGFIHPSSEEYMEFEINYDKEISQLYENIK
jgi:23S rRNA pseudouridine1911/1915/1917 synthase